MQSRDVRSGFLKFFESQRHRIVTSASLVPVDDPTLLFTNAGMNQFKDHFLGKVKLEYTRATTSQKCLRVSGHNDIDNVGPSLRHHTFFEMLGNFSFGDYFKREAIEFAWRVLTEVWGIPKDRMHASIFKGDERTPRDTEAYDLWRRYLPAEKIVEYGAEDNFWQMGDTGPCGRCSEIYFERPDGAIEIWNNVFMEFERSASGDADAAARRPASTPAWGSSAFAPCCRTRRPTTTRISSSRFSAPSGRSRGTSTARRIRADVSMRVVADHIRATTFLIGDGVVPSNEWRGYVLRKIMRRAMRHGKKLGTTEPFMHRLVDVLVAEMADAYPDLRTNRDNIVTVVRNEEERFDAVLTAGLPKIEDALDRAANGNKVVPGDDVFRLYDSLGVPLDFVEDLASERGLAVDREGYERAMEGAARSRACQQRVRGQEARGVRLHSGRRTGAPAGAGRQVRGLRRDPGGGAHRGPVRRGTRPGL